MKISGSVKKGVQVIGVILFITLCILLGISILKPTTLPEKQSIQDAFAKTMEHLRVVAKEPHPTGSLANQEVRKYLVDQFDRIQVTYENISFQLDGETYVDYLVKLDAPATDDGVMFVSHYDSVDTGPGATDDGISVASMLTVLEETIKRQNYTKDIYFLFTDGEELGLIGANYFVSEYKEKYIDKLKFVVNLEARGNQGPLFMFETTKNNYNIAKMLQKAVTSGSTPFSFAAAMYKRMPNDTDLTEFLEAGFSGMNFAVVEGGEYYHDKEDTPDNLNEDTAYMYYSTVSELASYLEDMDLEQLNAEEEGVYFPIAKGKFFLCTENSMSVFSIFSICLFIIIVAIAIGKRRVKLGKTVLSFSALGICLAASYGVLLVINMIFYKILESGNKSVQELALLCHNTYLLQMILTIVLCLLVFLVAQKHLRLQEHLLFYGSLFLVFSIVSFIVFPAITYMFSIVLFIISVLLFFTVIYRGELTKWLVPMLAGVLCLICAILYIPTFITIYQSILMYLMVTVAGSVLGIVEIVMFFLCFGTLLQSLKVRPISERRIRGQGYKSLIRKLLKSLKEKE
ncbi:MAG TPA: M28 family peptidase [Lachnospiraceae bacterium]|nr:M28 family peptidase [Lachnospiraceae bacterium]